MFLPLVFFGRVCIHVSLNVVFGRIHYQNYLCAVLCCSVMSDSLWPHGLYPTGLLCPWGFSRHEYWSVLPCPPPGDLPNPEIEPRSPPLQVNSLLSEPPEKPKTIFVFFLIVYWDIMTTNSISLLVIAVFKFSVCSWFCLYRLHVF